LRNSITAADFANFSIFASKIYFLRRLNNQAGRLPALLAARRPIE
jgi:hypothetical protein